MSAPTSIPARGSAYAHLQVGQRIRITQSEGPQVVDTWAFSISPKSSDSTPKSTYLSPTHTRSKLLKVSLSAGDTLYSNIRSLMLTLVEDTSPGCHDLLFAACDRHRYAQLGVPADLYHPSCADNLRAKLDHLSASGGLLTGPNLGPVLGGEWTPDPVNLFMNVPVASLEDGKGEEMRIEAPRSQKGDFVILRAEVELIVVMSACPMDLNEVNGGECRGVEFEVF